MPDGSFDLKEIRKIHEKQFYSNNVNENMKHNGS
jgi:hypothetical protein